MTTEIALINRECIALAADSAATIGGQRVWNTANKIFSLGPHNDIAVMIYNSASFGPLPWDTIVKQFRTTYKSPFATIQECADEFVAFLTSDLINKYVNDMETIFLFCLYKLSYLQDFVKAAERAGVSEVQCIDAIKQMIEKEKSSAKEDELDLKIKHDAFVSAMKSGISESLIKFISESLVDEALVDLVCNYCYESYKRKEASRYSSGLVIAGFGKDELLPSLVNYIIDGKYEGSLRYWIANTCNLNEPNTYPQIIPFAQTDMINFFMTGIGEECFRYLYQATPDAANALIERVIDSYVKDPVENAAAKKDQRERNEMTIKVFFEEFDAYRFSEIAGPVYSILNYLPKEEMASMAAALIELTSLKRKMDSTVQSVGGPTDVAIISKGDGFVWINRKFYFDKDFNSDFERRKKILMGA